MTVERCGQLWLAGGFLSNQMGQSGRVWKWTGMVLAVLCAALGIMHVLLTQLETTGTAPGRGPEAVLSSESSGGDSGAQSLSGHSETATSQRVPEASGAKATHDLRLEISDRQESNEPAQITNLRKQSENPEEIVEGKRSQVKDSRGSGAIDNRQSSILQSVRPLGIVETAGGRVQAVIQDGEWTRLVEAGEVLADNSRVLKVSAEGVEILRPASQPTTELARAGNAAPSETKAEIAVAAGDAQTPEASDEPIGNAEPVHARVNRPASTRARGDDDLPGMQTGEATAAPKFAPSAVPQRALKPVLPSQTDLRPSPVVGIDRPVDPNAALGRVEHADGRVQSVVADGQWVKLVAEPVRPGPDFNRAKGKAITEASGMGAFPNSGGSPETSGQAKDSETAPMTSGGGAIGLPIPRSDLIQDSESAIQNSVEPIGIVEWLGGRTQAVVIQGLSVSLVDDSKTLAEARRALALISSPGESGIDPRLHAAEQAGRQREDESASLALIENESPTRGPPGELESPLALPDESARGQPEDDDLADLSRAPPLGDSPEISLLEDDLPGFEDAAGARIEPLQSIKAIPDAILGRSRGGITGSVSEIHPHKNQNPLSPPPIALGNAQNPASAPEPSSGHERNRGPKVLGFVRLLDGRQRTVVSVGDSVMLVEEAADARAVQSERPTPAGNESVTSHPQTSGAHQTAGEPSGPGLQSGPRMRDNRIQSRR